MLLPAAFESRVLAAKTDGRRVRFVLTVQNPAYAAAVAFSRKYLGDNCVSIEQLKTSIRDVPDFPKKGIVFKDITPMLQNPELFNESLDLLAALHKNDKIDHIAAIESRGFIFGAALAARTGASFVPVRKKGKLPYHTIEESYSLEYGTATIEVHEDAFKAGDRVVIIDDVIATGGTAAATARLVEKLGAQVVSIDFLIELGFLNGREVLKDYKVNSLILF